MVLVFQDLERLLVSVASKIISVFGIKTVSDSQNFSVFGIGICIGFDFDLTFFGGKICF